ncbi:hypothetical protein PVAND_014419 [Polypedilum vanderplanki]|uniref:Uncharacterized protein n=1 Tax=Polypedilum vanderplanki TaxID=319348 RepID=A0A9J6B9U1_POLVA|nr:hypothetical protein PVAND_014419 [Polypedilum vanderplanki]
MELKIVIFLFYLTLIGANPIILKNEFESLKFFDDPDVISCNFEAPQAPQGYTCHLIIQNPLGRNNFTEIAGIHLFNFTNNDVEQVFGIYQNSLNIPSIICQSFPNTLDFIIEMSNIEVIDADTFVDCTVLEFIMIGINRIVSIPDGLFRNNVNLQVILLNDNRINQIASNAFAGTRATYIDLSYNQLGVYNPSWATAVNETLEILLINRNQFYYLPLLPFSDLGNLRELDLSRNPFTSINDYSFLGLHNLRRLYLNDLGLTAVIRNWFIDLPSLTHLFLGYNRIREINTNDFNNLTQITEINLNNNELTFINANGFGQSLSTLTNLHLTNNRIIAIDEDFFDQSQNLRWLLLNNNTCFSQNIYDVSGERNEIREQLSECFSNFIGSARCSMFDMQPYPYECVLSIMNPIGRDFDSIIVEHSEGRTDEDVIVVEALFQHSRNFPSVICRQFINVDYILIEESEIEFIDENSFVDCINLWQLTLGYNRITNIPDGTFRNNPNLEIFEGFRNQISRLGTTALTGSGLRTLALDSNSIDSFNLETFLPIAETLQNLMLADNRINQIPSGGFSRLTQLRWIDLSGNKIQTIPSNAFQFLWNLQHLELMDLGLTVIEPDWFTDLQALFDLRLDGNNFNSIPSNSFNNLRSLTTITLANNQIRNLHANSFGNSLNTLVYLLATNNNVRSLDPLIIDNAPSLQWLHLNNNFCANLNFYNIQSDLSSVREQLSECFRMFTGFMSCTYYDFFAYLCRLNIQNVQPRNDWTEVPGTHVDNRSNEDVRIVEVYMQDTANIPTILCSQFPQLTEIQVQRSFLQAIDEEMFEDCTNLESVVFSFNNLREIQDFTFVNSPRLESIEINSNRLRTIAPNSFFNLRLSFLELDHNELTEFNPQWLASSHETLMFLYISFNQIQDLPENSFSGLQNVIILDMGENPYRSIPPTVFDGLENLMELWIDRCGIVNVDERWFLNLKELRFVSLYDNQITTLRSGIFDNLPKLYELDLGNNRITMLHSDTFGSTAPNLMYVFVDFNSINAIDQEFFEAANQLVYLFVRGNLCIDRDFYNVNVNRNEVSNELSRCFNNFAAPGSISCYYEEYPNPGDYGCILTTVNPNGHEFDSISGNHKTGFGNEDVQKVASGYQNSRILPSILCDLFNNLGEIQFRTSQIQRIPENSLQNCVNLWRLSLDNNLITSLSSTVFRNLANLQFIELQVNHIHTLAPGSFANTAIEILSLGSNRLREMTNDNWQGIETTLKELYLFQNNLRNVQENLFGRLQNLEYLDLGLNSGVEIEQRAFSSLGNLQTLLIDNSRLGRIDPEWFQGLQNLNAIFIHKNDIHSLQPGVFASLTRLTEITMGGNPFESLNSDIFGNNLANIQRINAVNSQINAIDERIFDIAGNSLEILYLYDNECSRQNFYNVSNNLNEVQSSLEECFTNFRGNIQCHYVMYAGQYTCILLIQNIAGHDQFTEIQGDHDGATDADVLLVESLVQNTRNIPQILCRQFLNLEEIFIEESRIQRITIDECKNLQRLTLAYNEIEAIEAGTFANNEHLFYIDLRLNRLTRIADDVFAGTVLQNLDLSSNQLASFNPAWLSSILNTLQKLELYENSIISIDQNAFTTLTNLRTLDLGLNPHIILPPNIFKPLVNLDKLFIDSSGLRRIDSQWFSTLTLLTELHLHSNSIRSMPENVFTPLVNLGYLSVRDNLIRVINGNAFSTQMNNFTRFYAQSNRINGFDDQFFESISGQLEFLYLYDNVCISMNFYEVNQNQNIVREELQRCFDNFEN